MVKKGIDGVNVACGSVLERSGSKSSIAAVVERPIPSASLDADHSFALSEATALSQLWRLWGYGPMGPMRHRGSLVPGLALGQ